MGTTTVALDREAYELLRRQKRMDESFSDVVKRIGRPHVPLSKFAGSWKDIPKEVRAAIDEARASARRLDDERRERLLTALGGGPSRRADGP